MRFDGLVLVASHVDTIQALAALNKPLRLHLELDTGMKRHGADPEQLSRLLEAIEAAPHITLEGIMSHLADADNADSDEFTQEQVAIFDRAIEQAASLGHHPRWIHIAQSAGSTKASSKYATITRPGIALYGISPLASTDRQAKALAGLQPVMRVISRVSAMQQLKPHETASYSRTYEADQAETVCVIGFGYYEGLPRVLSNQATLLGPHQEALPIRGRICMNHTLLGCSGHRIKRGDQVTVISWQRSDPNSVESLAANHDIFAYELLVNLCSTTRRVIVE
jgi:alanine racemase